MNLNEDEKRMVYQIESTNQVAALNEIYMTWRYAPNQAMKDTAESLLKKLRPLSDKECMDVIREVQQNYRLPGKARTIGEMLAEARQQSGAQKMAGHDIMALERFDPDTRHMIVFDVLSHESPMSAKLDNTRVNRDVNNYLQEIIQHLMNVDGSEVELTLEVSVNAPNGIPSTTVRTVSENCRTLKVTDFGFEE